MLFGGMVRKGAAFVRAQIRGALLALLGVVLVLAGAGAVAGPAQAAGPFPVTEKFDSSSWGQFNHAGTAKLTAADGTDPDGSGWLRFNRGIQSLGYVWSDASFPSSQGWVVEFEYAMWGSQSGFPADGFSLFLWDADVPFRRFQGLLAACSALGLISSATTRVRLVSRLSAVSLPFAALSRWATRCSRCKTALGA